MTFYIFNCSTGKSLYGVTDDPIGAKLPKSACLGDRWVSRAEVSQSAIGFNAAEAQQGISTQGFHLFRFDVAVKGPLGPPAVPAWLRRFDVAVISNRRAAIESTSRQAFCSRASWKSRTARLHAEEG
jgi:hypothetical protein